MMQVDTALEVIAREAMRELTKEGYEDVSRNGLGRESYILMSNIIDFHDLPLKDLEAVNEAMKAYAQKISEEPGNDPLFAAKQEYDSYLASV